MPTNDEFVTETLKIAAQTQGTLMSSLMEGDPTLFLRVQDELTPKYQWGSFAHPLEILAQLRKTMSKAYGLGWTEWDPEVLSRFVVEQFEPISNLTENKIWALQSALTTDAPWHDYDIFENVALSFCNETPMFGVIQPIDLHELAFCLGVLDAIRTDVYSDEVRGYIAAVLQYNGVLACPPDVPLPSVNDIIQRSLTEEHRALRDAALDLWARGQRSAEEPRNVIENQLYNFQLLDEWYSAGRFYVPTFLKAQGVENDAARV
jgi:hypothetical protein